MSWRKRAAGWRRPTPQSRRGCARRAARAGRIFRRRCWREVRALKEFLFARMYRHPRVIGPMERAKAVVTDLFEALVRRSGLAAARLGGAMRRGGRSGDAAGGARLYRRHDGQLCARANMRRVFPGLTDRPPLRRFAIPQPALKRCR